MKIKISEIVKATKGTLLFGDENLTIKNIAIDSRSMQGADIFVPIIGEKTDGHKYIQGAFNKGAVAVFTSEHDAETARTIDPEGSHAWIKVPDTVAALQDLGKYLRSRFDIPFIGITGSVGKTSTREMVTCALRSQKRVTATAGNSNSQVGVPLTLSLMDEEADIAVMELGMSMPGEMSRIAAIARPQIALITNIGVSHIEQLGSQENILKEKLHITDTFGPDSILLINGDDPLLCRLKRAAEGDKSALPFPVPSLKIKTFGIGMDNDYRLPDYDFNLKVPGTHNLRNALAALAVCHLMGVDTKAAIAALEDYTGFGRRLEFKQLQGFTLIDDSYNASPDSMKAALEVLGAHECEGRRIAVLADMLELGTDSDRFHQEVGEYAATRQIDEVYMVGPRIRSAAAPIRQAGIPVHEYDSNSALAEDLVWGIAQGDAILLKGSNGMHLNEIADTLSKLKL